MSCTLVRNAFLCQLHCLRSSVGTGVLLHNLNLSESQCPGLRVCLYEEYVASTAERSSKQGAIKSPIPIGGVVQELKQGEACTQAVKPLRGGVSRRWR